MEYWPNLYTKLSRGGGGGGGGVKGVVKWVVYGVMGV